MPQGPQQPNFKTNVNRAKTKRWVEAKSYSYDGDDWGDADEYDEYGGYDEPAPPPPKPTGLRQRGQSATQSTQNPPQQQPPLQSDGRHGYSNLGGQPAALPPQGMRSATNPQPRLNTKLARSNSFERGDEARAFSAGGYQQGLPEQGIDVHDAAVTSQTTDQLPFSQHQSNTFAVQSPEQMQTEHPHLSSLPLAASHPAGVQFHSDSQQSRDGSRNYSLGDVSRTPPAAQQPPLQGGIRTQPMLKDVSAQPVYGQGRLASLSNTPPPRAQAAPIRSEPPHPGPTQQHRPPRKSSLSQQAHPQPAYNAPTALPASVESAPHESSQRERSGSNAGKPLPFVRPADIYRRLQEDKERERQSQESSRPTLDAINREHSPNEPSISSTLGEGPLQQLDYVGERAEAMDHNRSASDVVSSGAQDIALPKGPSVQGGTLDEGRLPHVPDTSQPMLPDVTRFSRIDASFLDIGGEGRQLEEQKPSAVPAPVEETSPTTPTTHGSTAPSTLDTTLKHQPSAGFRSVVNQAFDQAPATPSTDTGSSVERSTSGSTSAKSPPVSRGPSSAAENIASRMNTQRTLTPPPKIMDTVPEERRMSSSSGGTPKAEKPLSGGAFKDSPKSIIPGHRRNMSTPSPDNSPARTPAIENITRLQSPQEAEMAIATPISPAMGSGSTVSFNRPLHEGEASQPSNLDAPTLQQTLPPLNPRQPTPISARTPSPTKSLANSVREREGSPSTNRVKDIAGKFESASRRASDQSLSEKNKSQNAETLEREPDSSLVRPNADRSESFRPHLPGGWDSYGPSAATGKRASMIKDGPHPLSTLSVQQASSGSPHQRAVTAEGEHPSQTTKQAPLVSPIQDPFTALSAAGSALAGAFSVATGHEAQMKDEIPKRDQSAALEQAPDNGPPTHRSPVLGNPSDVESVENTPRQAPPKLTSLDTERKHQYESDRLRREIVKSLSPNKTSEPTTADSETSWQASPPGFTSATDVQKSGTVAEKPTLPSEYDSYWNDESSPNSSRSNSRRQRTRSLKNVPQRVTSHPVDHPTPLHLKHDHAVPPQQSQDTSDAESSRPFLMAAPYSWERPEPVETSPTVTDALGDATNGKIESTSGQNYAEDSKQSHLSSEPVVGARGDSLHASGQMAGAPDQMLSKEIPSIDEQRPITHTPTSDTMAPEQHYETGSQLQNDAPGISDETSLPAQAPVPFESKRLEDSSPHPVGAINQPRVQGFREIMALKTPQERINAFNDARSQYAITDTGLQHWLSAKSHEIVIPPLAQSSTGAFASVTQQPSAHPISNVNLQPGTTASSGGRSHGSSPASTSGAKLNRQQLQSKGKDLLKDANVLGGKANVAAKGLFMKGRNKLRGADKV